MEIPATAWPILRLLQKVSSFKIMEEPLVKSWIKTNIVIKIIAIKELLFEQGTITLILVTNCLVLGLFALCQKFQLMDFLKKKLMWTPFLRSQI